MSDEHDDPWTPHDPWRDDGRRPGMRAQHIPVDRGTSLADLPNASPAEPSPLKPTLAGPITGVESAADPAYLRLQIVTSDGVPVARQEFRVAQSGDVVVWDQTTDEGLAVVQVRDEGTYDVEFDPMPVKLPPRPAEQVIEPGPWLPRDTNVVRVSTTRACRLVLTRPACTEILVDGWAQGSVVMRWGGMRPRTDGTVATTRGALRLALQAARTRTMCVGGHADPLGTDAANDEVATQRANSVHLFLSGQLYLWAEHAMVYATELDVQCAIAACHVILGLGACTLDNEDAIATALGEIRSRANAAAAEEGESPRSSDAPFCVYDWRVVANLYDLDLAIFMGTDRAGLMEIRKRVQWTEAPTLSFGERHPRPQAELVDVVQLPALSHRRVSLLVFGKNDGAQMAVDAGGDEIYDGTYTRTVIPVPGEVLVQIRVAAADGTVVAKGRAWLDVGDLGTSEYTAGPDGIVRLLTLCGDRIRVVAAFDAHGLGTMISAALEES